VSDTSDTYDEIPDDMQYLQERDRDRNREEYIAEKPSVFLTSAPSTSAPHDDFRRNI